MHEGSVEDKAKNTLMAYLVKHQFIVQCGERVYSHRTTMLVQYDGAYPEITPQELTYAAKLNRVEWAGAGEVKYTAWRSYQSRGGWSPWHSPKDPEPHFTVWKEKGRWFVAPDTVGKEVMRNAQPLDCKAIEALPH